MQTFILLFATIFAYAQAPALPDAPTRARMVKELAAEMERLDGEALFVRKNRPHTFAQIAEQLASQAEQSRDWRSLLKVFSRLDSAYPNLHASFTPGNWFKSKNTKFQPKAQIGSDWLAPGKVEYRISKVDAEFTGVQVGDKVLALNGRSMKEVGDKYFEFCKMPLREQCDEELPYFMELDGKPLVYTLERDGRQWQLEVPVKEVPRTNREYEDCEIDKDLYEGFTLAYKGRFACFFEKSDDPGTVLLRIRSFYYLDKNHPIQSVIGEVEAFWPWWKARAPRTQHLVIDLAENGGGNAPIPYYGVFFPRPFQEQWAAFRKLPELLNPVLREGVFWGETAQEIWFQNILREGVWENTAWGEFFGRVPMFCRDPQKDCREGLFSPRDHGFKGRVTLVVNPNCVSACDGFVYAFHEEMNARVVGQPQAADSAYSRLTINVNSDKTNGFRFEIVPLGDESSQKALFSQKVVISRSVTSDGTEWSGIPVPVDQFVPRFYNQTPEEWRSSAVRAAVQ